MEGGHYPQHLLQVSVDRTPTVYNYFQLCKGDLGGMDREMPV